MIIDTHAHIGKVLHFDMTIEQIVYSMNRYGVDFTLLSNIEAVENDHEGNPVPAWFQKTQNELLRKTIALVRPHADKLGILVWMKCRQEQPDEEMISLIRENRDLIYGVKLHPFHSRTAPDDPRLEPVYALARRFNLPVVSHTGGCEEARSVHLYQAAKAHPDLNFVMVHMDLGTDNSEAIALLGKLPNLYGDTTWVPVSSTAEAVKRWGSGKMLFGTDNPIDGKDTLLHNQTGERSLYQAYFHEFKTMVSPEAYADVMYRNAQKLFHITFTKSI